MLVRTCAVSRVTRGLSARISAIWSAAELTDDAEVRVMVPKMVVHPPQNGNGGHDNVGIRARHPEHNDTKSILLDAIELPAEQRVSFLDRACHGGEG